MLKLARNFGVPLMLVAMSYQQASAQGWQPGSPPYYNGVAVYGQCVNFVSRYATQVLNCPFPPIGTYRPDLYAHWIYDDSRLQPANTTRIPNDGSNYPQSQDIVVWSSSLPGSGGAGHVAIVDSASSRNNIVVVDSNWGGDEAGRRHQVSLNHVLGWFRKNSAATTLYRYLNVANGDHFYTTNFAELGNGSGNYVRENDMGRVYTTQVSATVRVYRYYNPSSQQHFYTTNYAELGGGGLGYVLESDTFYVYPSDPGPGGTPMYRYLDVTTGNHFYTTVWSELGSGSWPWQSEGIAWWMIAN